VPELDIDLLKRFEQGLDPRHPGKSKIAAKVIGYGEISTIFEIEAETLAGWAFKRLPIFKALAEVDQYEQIFIEYNKLLKDEVGIDVPEFTCARIIPEKGNIVVFDIQRKLPSESMGHRAIHVLDNKNIATFVEIVLRELKKVWTFNKRNDHIRIGIDGQISNWAIKEFDIKNPHVDTNTQLYYIDTSTPFIQKDGEEQLNPELFLRSAPSFLVWLVKWLFLEDVMTRYYDFHLVAVDVIANFYKEQRPDLIPELVDTVNKFFATEAKELGMAPVTQKEVRSYYRQDAMIWRIYLAIRKLDRFLYTRLLHKPYVYILPGKIKR